MEHLI
jgi:hypothetical protein